jgi:hypothetical protein
MSSRSPYRGWITARKITQIAVLLIMIVLLIMTRRGGWPPKIVNLVMRIDPLAVLAQAASSRSFFSGRASVVRLVVSTGHGA